MRILFVAAAELLTDHLGHGEGLIAWNLLSRLAARGHNVFACAPRVEIDGPLSFTVYETGTTLPYAGAEPFAQVVKVRRLLQRIERGGELDALHWLFPQDQRSMVYPRAVLALFPARLPLVVGPVALPWTKLPGIKYGRTQLALEALARPLQTVQRRRIIGGTRVLAATPDVSDELPPPWPAACTPVPFGIDVDLYAFDELAADTPPRAAFVGSLQRYKGVRELVEAFGLVRDVLPEARLDVVGEGPEREWLEREIEKRDLGDTINLLGRQSPDDVRRVLRRSWALVAPSHVEAFGMAILEAMATGRPVVAARTGGPKTLVRNGEGGYLVERESPRELAAAITALLSDRSLSQGMGRFNRERTVREYSWASVLSRLEGVYAELAGHRS